MALTCYQVTEDIVSKIAGEERRNIIMFEPATLLSETKLNLPIEYQGRMFLCASKTYLCNSMVFANHKQLKGGYKIKGHVINRKKESI